MASRRKKTEEGGVNLDSLMDALTNVVAVLILILILLQVDVSNTVEKLLGDAHAGDRTVLLKIHNESLAQRYEPILHAVGEAGGEVVHVLNKTMEN